MTRGGKRSTSWAPSWRHGPTKTIRVPIALAEQILAFARALDESKDVESSTAPTDSLAPAPAQPGQEA